jgi:chromosome partitioning protein
LPASQLKLTEYLQQVNLLTSQLVISEAKMLIALANQKGGVAKTTTTIGLGGLLAQRGATLAIDLDPQGNLTTGLGIELADNQLTMYEVITERNSVSEVIVTTRSGVDLIPSDINLAKGEPEILAKVGNFYLLRDALEDVQGKYQHILIDCPPSLGLLTLNALTTADVVLIPVQCQFFALKGLAALLETIQSVKKRLNPKLKILGVLPTMAEKNTVMTQDILAALTTDLKDIRIFDPVPKSVKFAESNVAGLPIHLYTQDSKLIEPYLSIVNLLESGVEV